MACLSPLSHGIHRYPPSLRHRKRLQAVSMNRSRVNFRPEDHRLDRATFRNLQRDLEASPSAQQEYRRAMASLNISGFVDREDEHHSRR
jgi:hypothetical protein